MTADDIIPLVKKHPISVTCGVISLACAVLLYFRGDKIEEYQKLNEEKTAEAATTIANVRNAEKLVEQTAAMQATAKELDSRLIRAGQLAANLQYFYRMEADTGVKLVDVRQGGLKPGAKGPGYIGVPYTVSVQGNFLQVLTFLGRVQKGAHFCRFISVNLTKAGGSEEQMTLSMNLEILGVP
jgi:Tfp pilus assembly protein PilO